jgi:hypothetical protein
MLALLGLGCAQITPQTPTQADKPLRTVKMLERTGEITGTVEQDGLNLVITASHACRLREDRVVRRTTTIEHKNATPSIDWFWLGVGASVAATGAILLADAGSVYDDDRDSRTYNPMGSNGARALGYGLLATGGAFLVIPVVDVIRAGETKVNKGEVRIEGELLGDDVPCSDAPVVDVPVIFQFEQIKESLGSTDREGTLDIQLDKVLNRKLIFGKVGKAEVLVGDTVLGRVLTKPLVTVREARAWMDLPRGQCRTPTTPDDCNEVISFLQQYPEGAHVSEVRLLLQEARPKIELLKEAKAWTDIDLTACTSGKATTPEEIETACAPLRSYLSRFPDGAHVNEATRAEKIGQRRVDELRARLAKEAKEAQDRTARQEKDAEEKERLKERRKCEAVCRFGCSSSRFRGREGVCFQACVEAQCNP